VSAPALRFSGALRVAGRVLFDRIELTAPAGHWTCLLGPSGIGKSTVLHGFAGLAETDGAATAADGHPLPGRVALMAQSDMLLPWLSIGANVTLGDRLRGTRTDADRAARVLRDVGLADLAQRKPRALSGGQRQRAALARVLYEDRPVVLLDEPFSALDVATRTAMQALAARELAGRTVLHVTHDPAEAARLGQQILIMTRAGITPVPPAAAPIPRAPDAADTLTVTGALTRALLETAP